MSKQLLKHADSMPTLANSDDDESSNNSNSQNSNNSSNSSNSNSNNNGDTNTPVSVHRCNSQVDFNSIVVEQEGLVEPHTGPKTVLVTGGAGFIGSHVAQVLLARGDKVVIIDELNDYYNVDLKRSNLDLLRLHYPSDENLVIYQGDICNVELVTQIFQDHGVEWVCHMAARAGVRPSIQDPYVYIHSNIKGTTHLMELAAKYNVQNFVFASSSSVYGGSKSTFFSEDEVVDNPVSPYAASKKACELLAYPRGRPDMAPFKFIDRVSRGVEIQQFGDGSSSRDYTYIDDIVEGIVRALDRPHPYEVFNLGKGSGTSLKEFIGLVQKHVGRKAIIKVLPDQPGDVPYTCADVSKAQRLLGYKSQYTFEQGIQKTAEWYKETYGVPPSLEEEEEEDPTTLAAMESNQHLKHAVSIVDFNKQMC
eukprot:CAMPEP_0168810330 /NCGR_PEP_ID=MMETSP0726-20121227/3546_1 /TAXON_ID=265536 /ORGANISM="Amphiprora sp., Strain CCMP467" /LENGTH=420 /DNA_ID=CAMNT_0008862343 /DNA_START=350 /DNA_END=1612 /DNA_ORIENTATION=-